MFENIKKLQRQGLSGSEKRRIIILISFLVVLTVAIISLSLEANKGRNTVQVEKEGPAKTLRDPHEVGVQLPPNEPVLDLKEAEKVQDATPAQRRVLEPEPAAYLLREVIFNNTVRNYDHDAILLGPPYVPKIHGMEGDRPSGFFWRFRMVRFHGRLRTLEELGAAEVARLFGIEESEIDRVYAATVELEGDPDAVVRLYYPFRPVDREGNALQVGDWSRGRGVFLKRMLTPKAGGGEEPVLVLVASRIDKDLRPKPVTSLEEIGLEQIQDGKELRAKNPTQMMEFYKLQLMRMLRYASARAGAEGTELRKKEGLVPRAIDDPQNNFELWEGLHDDPAKYRKEYFGGKGVILVEHQVERGEAVWTNDAGIRTFGSGWIKTDRNRILKYVAPIALGEEFPGRTRIYFEGYFYKIQGYKALDNSEKMAPFFVLTRLEKYVPPPQDRTSSFLFIGAFAVGIGLIIFFIVREDKTKADYRARHRRRHSESEGEPTA